MCAVLGALCRREPSTPATPEFYEYPTATAIPAVLVQWRHVARRRGASDVSGGINGASQPFSMALPGDSWRSEHPRQALVAYEQQRLPMTAEIVRSNRRGGPEGVIDGWSSWRPTA